MKIRWGVAWNFNLSTPSVVSIRQWTGLALVQVMAWCQFGANLLPEQMLHLLIGPFGTNVNEIQIEIKKRFIYENAFKNVVGVGGWIGGGELS